MNPFIRNFTQLFSNNQNEVYKAILIKKDWMFKKLYFPVTFDFVLEEGKEMYYDLYSLVDQSILFKKVTLDDALFLESKENKQEIEDIINQNFRVAYCYENIPSNTNNTFYVEMDFNLIEKQVYHELVANFYPCIDEVKDLELEYNKDNIVDLLKYPMYGEYKKWVFILPIDKLLNDKYYLPIMKKIWYSKNNLTKEQIEAIEVIAEKLEIKCEEL